MSGPTTSEALETQWQRAVRTGLGGLGILAVLGVALLGKAAGGPEWLAPLHVATAMLLVAGVAMLARSIQRYRAGIESDLESYRFGLQVVLFGLLVVVLHQSQSPGYGVEASRPVAAAIVFTLLVGFCVSARDPREYSIVQWVILGSLAILLAIFFRHGLDISVTSGMARFPFWYGSIMAVGLVVVPQYLTRAQFVWAVNRYAAMLVLLALPVYVVGEYTLWGLEFGFHGAYTIPLVGFEVEAVRSLFVNRNAFALAVFGGFVAAIGEFLQGYRTDRPWWALVVPGVLLLINAAGLALSYGRALWVITPMAVLVYLAYLAVGQRAVPIAVVLAFGYLIAGIAAVHSGIVPLPEDTPTRAQRWYPALEAVLDQESLLGAGFVDPGEFIAPYHPTGSSGSPHNSYLTMGIWGGIVGGIVYLVLIASSLLAGLLEILERDDVLTVAVIALGVGFTAHQQFEAYRLFNWGPSPVLAVFVFGFLAFGERAWAGESDRDRSDVPEHQGRL